MMVRVAVAQEEPRWETRAEGLAQRVMGMARAGAAQGARLVVLPALLGWSRVGPRLGLGSDAPFGPETLPPANGVAGLYEPYHVAGEEALEIYRDVARALGVWLVGGSLPEVSAQGALYNATPVIALDGSVAGCQREIHVPAVWRRCGLARGTELAVIPSAVGTLGLLLGEDVRYPEVGRILTLLGADVLVHQGAWRSASTPDWMSRLWREVQANQVFGLESAPAGRGFRGRAAVYAPCEMLPDASGVLAQSASDQGNAVISATLDFDARRRVLETYPILRLLNPEVAQGDLARFYAQEMPS